MKGTAPLVLLSALALLFELSSNASATVSVIGFDDLIPAALPGSGGPGGKIPNTYAGFVWQNFYFSNAPLRQSIYGLSGYIYGTVSPENAALNGAAQPATLSQIGGAPFTFNGAYFTGAWNDNLNIEALGYRSGSLVYDGTIVASATVPAFFTFNYQNIDSLTLRSFGGTPHPGFKGLGVHFVMDNFTYTVSESSALALLAIGCVACLTFAGQFKSCQKRRPGH
jgi:hypothetical protein